MTTPLIYKKLIEVTNQIDPIEKGGVNSAQNYRYRRIDDILNALHGIFGRVGIICVPTLLESTTERRDPSKPNSVCRLLKIKFTFYAEDGSFVEAVTMGEGVDSGDKASNKAMTAALKYALTQVFTIPDDDELKDSEHPKHEENPSETEAKDNATPDRLMATSIPPRGLNRSPNKAPPTNRYAVTGRKVSPAQIDRLFKLVSKRGLEPGYVEDLVVKAYGVGVQDLDQGPYNEFCDRLLEGRI